MLFYGNPLFLSSIYMHEGGKWKSNDLKYARINKTKTYDLSQFQLIKWDENIFLISWLHTIMVM